MPITQGVNDGYGPVLGAPARDYAEVNDLDFMNLLVAQIQNQDPLSPMDNSEFTSQISQFTMLDRLESMNALLEENLYMGQSINNTGMLALVGRDVTVEGNAVTMAGGQATETMLMSQSAGVATIEVTDSSGHVVRTYTEDVDTGLNTVSWDGKLDNMEMAEDGDYTVTVSVKAADGETEVSFTTLMTGPVQGMRYENNVAVVMVGGRDFYVTDIYKVS